MGRKTKQLSRHDISRIRANISRRASVIGDRLARSAEGTLTDNDGNPIEMTASQLKSAEIILKHTLPAQAQTEVTDVTDNPMTREEMEAQGKKLRQQIIESLTAEEISQVMKVIPVEGTDEKPLLETTRAQHVMQEHYETTTPKPQADRSEEAPA